MPKAAAQPIPGVRVVTERIWSASPEHTSVLVSCFATDRSRIESQGSEAGGYTIERRDLARHYRIDTRRKEYRSVPECAQDSPRGGFLSSTGAEAAGQIHCLR